MLLMMSIYGLGAGEVIRFQLQDIDWDAGTLRDVRPKTGGRHLAVVTGRGQGTGALPARRPATAHTNPSRVRAD